MGYALAKNHLSVIGKRVRIKSNALGYASYLLGRSGVVEELYDKLFMRFDEHFKSDTLINGCYLNANVWELV